MRNRLRVRRGEETRRKKEGGRGETLFATVTNARQTQLCGGVRGQWHLAAPALNIGHGRGERETGGVWWWGKERERKEGRDLRTDLSSSSISLPPLFLSIPLPSTFGCIKSSSIRATVFYYIQNIQFVGNVFLLQHRIPSCYCTEVGDTNIDALIFTFGFIKPNSILSTAFYVTFKTFNAKVELNLNSLETSSSSSNTAFHRMNMLLNGGGTNIDVLIFFQFLPLIL